MLLTAVVVAGAFPLGQETPSVGRFPSAVELITAGAVVVDKDGHLASGLTKEDVAAIVWGLL